MGSTSKIPACHPCVFLGEGNTEIICKSCTVPTPSRERFVHIPPWEKENHRLKIDFSGDMSVPWRVYINTGKKRNIFRAILEHIGPFHKISMLELKLRFLLGWWPNDKLKALSHDCIGWPNKKYQNLLYWKLCTRSKEIETLKKTWLTREQLLFPPPKKKQLTLSGENPGAKDGCMEQRKQCSVAMGFFSKILLDAKKILQWAEPFYTYDFTFTRWLKVTFWSPSWRSLGI